MKIAHVIRRLSFDDWGGTEQVVWNIARAQVNAGHEVKIFATTALCKTKLETADGLEIRRFDAIYPWWPMSKKLVAELDRRGGNPFVPGLAKSLRQWGPQVVHCHAMGRIAELCLRTAAKIGAKSVVSLHGGASNIPEAEALSLKAPTRGLFPWGKLLDCALGWRRRIPEDAGGIVCVGQDEYEHYEKLHPHVMYLPNGVDASLFAKGAEGRKPMGKDVRMLCVARIDRQKNQMMLVEALARHPNLRLCLVGPVTQQDYMDEIRHRVEEIHVEERFRFAGACKPGSDELLDEYRNADVFALASRHEPFGIVVLEAWAAGLPVIASAVGGLERLCAAHPKAALLFKPGDEAEFDAALSRLISEDGIAKEMAEAGLQAAREYDWNVLAQRLMQFYASI